MKILLGILLSLSFVAKTQAGIGDMLQSAQKVLVKVIEQTQKIVVKITKAIAKATEKTSNGVVKATEKTIKGVTNVIEKIINAVTRATEKTLDGIEKLLEIAADILDVVLSQIEKVLEYAKAAIKRKPPEQAQTALKQGRGLITNIFRNLHKVFGKSFPTPKSTKLGDEDDYIDDKMFGKVKIKDIKSFAMNNKKSGYEKKKSINSYPNNIENYRSFETATSVAIVHPVPVIETLTELRQNVTNTVNNFVNNVVQDGEGLIDEQTLMKIIAANVKKELDRRYHSNVIRHQKENDVLQRQNQFQHYNDVKNHVGTMRNDVNRIPSTIDKRFKDDEVKLEELINNSLL